MGGTTTASLGGRQQQLTEPDEGLTEDDLFELLSNQRRRYILHTLIRDGGPVTVGDLSQEIAAWEDDVAYDAVTSADRKRVYTALQQSHLPMMDRTGVLEFDKDRGTVSSTDALDDIEIYMDVVHGREIPWSDYYLGLTVLSASLLVAMGLGTPIFGGLTLSAWSAFVVTAFGVSSLAHRYYSRKNRLGIDETPPECEAMDDDDHENRGSIVESLLGR